MKINWNILSSCPHKKELLQQQLKIHPVLCQLLIQRGIETYDEAHQFFRPNINQLHNPFLMNDMAKAIERIQYAIANNQHILIYGDYDVDGTTAVSLVYGFFKKFYHHISYYIPNRYTEGYGVSKQGIDWAHDNNCKLIISLDCGITAVEQVDYANENGIDFIICDHHQPSDVLPNAFAILDAKRKDNTYPFNELSGAGVGFKLIQAFAQQYDIPFAEVEKQLDLVAISIASDLVPIVGENRILCYYGLKLLNEKPRPGIETLINISNIKGEININSIVFAIGPRINAAGRIEHGANAVKLLIAEDLPQAYEYAQVLNEFNIERKGHDKSITEQALEVLAANEQTKNKKSTVVFGEGWHKGVIGIVASRLMDTYYKPTVVLTQNNGILIGSARSVKDFDIYEALKKCEDLLEKFGGHKYAAGLQLSSNNYNEFVERFEKIVAETISEKQQTPELDIDAELQLHDISPSFFNILKQFAPFGPGNHMPVFVSKNLSDFGTRLINDKHLKFSLKNNDRLRATGIGFDMKHYFDLLKTDSVDVAYHLEENDWQGNKSIEWRVKDIQQSNNF